MTSPWLFYPGDAFLLFAAAVTGQVAVIVVIAFALSRFPKRRSAATRSAIWLAALIAAFCTPAIAGGLRVSRLTLFRLPVLPRAVSADATVDTFPPISEAGAPRTGFAPNRTVAPDPIHSGMGIDNGTMPTPRSSTDTMDTSDLASRDSPASASLPFAAPYNDRWRGVAVGGFLLWLVGVSILMARFLTGCVAVTRIRGRARPLRDDSTLKIHQDVCAVLGIERVPQLMTSRTVVGPIATDGRRGPMVILPRKMVAELDDNQIRDVLTHECAHLLQRDVPLGMLQRLAQIVYWPHPLVHLLNRELSAAREDLCDNHVVRQGDATRYARTLVQLSTEHPRQRTPISACGMASPISQLQSRIEALLDEGRNLMTDTKRSVLITISLFFFGMALLSFGGSLHSAVAEQEGEKEKPAVASDAFVGDANLPIISKVVFSSPTGGRILSVAYSPDDELIATLDDQSSVSVHIAQSGRLLLTFNVLTAEETERLEIGGRNGRIHAANVCFSPDGETLAVCYAAVIRFFDPETGKMQRSLRDERLIDELIELGKDKPAELKKMDSVPHAHGMTYSIAFSPDGSSLASCGSHLLRPGGRSLIDAELATHGKLKLWDVNTGELKQDLGKHYSSVRALAFGSDRLAVIGAQPPSWTSALRLWNTTTAAVDQILPIRRGGIGGEETIAISPDGSLVAATAIYADEQQAGQRSERLGRGSCKLLIWDTQTGELLHQREMAPFVTSIAFSPDGQTLATGSSRNGISFWQPRTLANQGRIEPLQQRSDAPRLAFSQDGTRLAVTTDDNDKAQGFLTLYQIGPVANR